MEAGSEPRAPLSPHYAFVVQYATDTQIDTGRLQGRVEHVMSRQATHFTSLEELLAFMARTLLEVAEQERLARAEREQSSTPDSSQT